MNFFMSDYEIKSKGYHFKLECVLIKLKRVNSKNTNIKAIIFFKYIDLSRYSMKSNPLSA